MKTEIKKLWVKALRSGEYEQGKGALVQAGNKRDYFCCLGVLTDLYIERHVCDGWHEQKQIDGSRFLFGGEGYFIPARVRRWAGIADRNPLVRAKDGLRSLTSCNDTGKSFDEIADAIEKSL